MPDREKVIKALEICEMKDCAICSYTDWCGEYDDSYYDCTKLLAKDALDLLNKQQQQIWEFQDQVEYLTDKLKEQETTDTNDLRIFHCKKCGYGIEDIFISDEHNYSLVPKFCPNCGRSVNNWMVMIEHEGR